MRQLGISIFGWMCIGASLHAAPQRIALLPSFSDFDQRDALRAALPAFDARLKAELVETWDSDVLARTGLSAVVFEQKLRTQADATARITVLPADALVLCVLDFQKQELRVHLNPVKPGMKPENAKVFRVKDATHLAEALPGEVARHLAASLKLTPNAPKTSPDTETNRLTCALLEPVTTSGSNQDMTKASPLIRAVLEQTIGSQEIELVERGETAKLLQEKILTEAWNPNTASRLGHLAKADLILSPVIHAQNAGRIHTDLFALDVASGRVLACRSWSGAPLDPPPAERIRELLAESASTVRDSKKAPVKDNPGQRHAEAEFLLSLSDSWLGLRQLIGTEAELALHLADAGLGLSHDNPDLMGKVVAEYTLDAVPAPNHPRSFEFSPSSEQLPQIRELQQSGQLALMRQAARAVFEVPLIELSKNGNDRNKRCLASLYIGLGEPQKALDALTGGRPLNELAQNNVLYERVAQALMNLGRYRECVDFIHQRSRWSRYSTYLMADAYRAMGDREKEFDLYHKNPASAGSSEDRLARYLDLGRELGHARATVSRALGLSNGWMINRPPIWEPLVRARMAAGLRDEAISDAQCARLAAHSLKDKSRFDRMTALLKELDASPIAKLPTPAQSLALPGDCRIDLIHDQTIPADHARKVAGHLATFWGCPVALRAIRLDAGRMPFYDKISQSMVGQTLANTMLRALSAITPSLGTVFLTRQKLISKSDGYVGDIYSTNAGDVKVLSDHYFSKYQDYDPRDLSYITAVAAASLAGPERKLTEDLRDLEDMSTSFAPLPPDVFANNGVLHVAALDLGISPRTASLLKRYTPAELLEWITRLRQTALEENAAPEETARELSSQLSNAASILVAPEPIKAH